ncbi:hypothetical protein ACHAXN_001647 [Cyclotella atomus]
MTSAQIRPLLQKLSPRLSRPSLSQLSDSIERIVTSAPQSAFSIPDSVRHAPELLSRGGADSSDKNGPGAAIRSIGTSRRVFLLNSTLTPEEMEGLAYRIKTLSTNDGINSVVVANPLEDADCDGNLSENETLLPYFMEEGGLRESALPKKHLISDKSKVFVSSLLEETYGPYLGMPYVSGGYDARAVYHGGLCDDKSELERVLMKPIMDLSEAMRGDYDTTTSSSKSKVPIIGMTHGLTSDAGYVFLSGSYALATDATSYRILNPLRGLTLDPVGLSYLLTRLGETFDQESVMPHSWGCAILLSLIGYEANSADLVSTGLATHYIGSPYKLNVLERGLMNINSYQCQRLKRNPIKLYGHEHESKDDINEQYYNVPVGNLIQSISEYDAAGAQEYGVYLKNDLDEETRLFLKEKDPSLKLPEDRIQIYNEVISDLVNWSATFESVWQEESVEGIMERLREIAATKSEFVGKLGYEEDVAVAEQAEYFVSCMEQRSPLSLQVTYALLCKATGEEEDWTSCMEREKVAQMNLMMMKDGDFERWAKSGMGVGLTSMEGKASLIREKEGVFDGWRHGSVKDVSEDEVAEIVRD